jgi:hypothetical protein
MSLYLDAPVYQTHTRQYDAPAVAGDGVALLEGQFKKVTGDAEMAQIIAALEAEHAERNRFRRRRQRETTRGPLRKLSTDVMPTSVALSCRGAVRMMNTASRDSYSDEPEGLGVRPLSVKLFLFSVGKVLGLSESALSCCRCYSVAS